jgi:hypothetical protein
MNDRELAVLIWTGISAVAILGHKDLRPHALNVLRVVVRPVIVVPLVAFAAYTLGLLTIGSQRSLWTPELTGDSVAWFIAVGLGLFFDLEAVFERPDFFRRAASRAVRITVFVEVFVNLAVFSLPIEFVLLPTLAFLTTLAAFASLKPEHRPAQSCAEGLLSLFGFAFVIYVGIEVLTNTDDFDDAWRRFALPVWLTLGALPFIYMLGLYAAYQVAFGQINAVTDDRRRRRQAKAALLVGLGVRARVVGAFRLYYANQIAEAESYRGARAVVAKFRRDRREEEQFEVDRLERLERYAGVEGTDDEGRQLDQREFDETKEALQAIAMAQSGWYANPERRYTHEFMYLLEPFPGLPDDHGIELLIAEDGQSWFAWRRTVTGWCFAIGARGEPNTEWLHDGPEPPSGFPGEDPAWGSGTLEDAINWRS